MSKNPIDINDNEIRVISPSGIPPTQKRKKRILLTILAIIAIVTSVSGVILYCILTKGVAYDKKELSEEPHFTNLNDTLDDSIEVKKGFVEVVDSVINGNHITFLFPRNATPLLMLGEEALTDTTSTLVVQAADIRADNGKIAGTFVLKGDLISKGDAKAGFCAIVNDKITIGVADATPMLEQAIENNGYFFRQYPLVVGGQLVENKPKGRSLRKALVEIDGKIGVAMSNDIMTFHDFSNVLIEAGVRNAIYLVGSTSPGYYHDKAGNLVKFGKEIPVENPYVSFLIWR